MNSLEQALDELHRCNTRDDVRQWLKSRSGFLEEAAESATDEDIDFFTGVGQILEQIGG